MVNFPNLTGQLYADRNSGCDVQLNLDMCELLLNAGIKSNLRYCRVPHFFTISLSFLTEWQRTKGSI